MWAQDPQEDQDSKNSETERTEGAISGGFYHPGPYCYEGRQSCASCRLNGKNECSYVGKEHGEHTRVAICSKWEEVLGE